MGYEKYGLNRLELVKFDKGYFPNKDFDDVPEGGSSDCNHVIWDRSALRKMFGMDQINTSAAATLQANGLYYMDVSGTTKRTACFGTGFYEDVVGTWTARTGAITLTDGNLVQFETHQLNANKYIIGVNGVDAPFKWTGTGNAAVLAGSPPILNSICKYRQIFFGGVSELVYFSGIGDPESWTTGRDVVNFEKTIVRVLNHGAKVAVLMADRIGSIQGYSYLDMTAEQSEISTIGCVGRLAACNANFGVNKTKVIATLSKDGLYFIDEAFGFQKIFGDDYISQFKASSLAKASLAYTNEDQLLYVAIPYSTSSDNDYLIVVDMRTGAFWPGSSIHTNYVRVLASMRDSNSVEWMYFADSAGYAYKFNRATANYHTGTATQAIGARFKSKKFDMKDVHQFRDIEMLADASGDWNVNISLAVSLDSNDGTMGAINLLDSGDVLGSTFILGASTLGGSSYVFKSLDSVDGFGRYFVLTFANSTLSQNFNIRKVEVLTKRRRRGRNDK